MTEAEPLPLSAAPLDAYVRRVRSGKLTQPLPNPVLLWVAPVEGAAPSQALTLSQLATDDPTEALAKASLVFELPVKKDEPSRVVLGRGRDCELCIQVPSVSRHHAELALWDGSWRVKDLGSHNGTVLDKERLAGNETRALADGARLWLGGITLVFMGPTSFLEHVGKLAWR